MSVLSWQGPPCGVSRNVVFDIIPPIRGHRKMPWERKSADTTYVLDEQTVTLHLTVSPALLPPTVLNLRTDRPPGITYSQDTSAFLNYALNVSDFERVDAFG